MKSLLLSLGSSELSEDEVLRRSSWMNGSRFVAILLGISLPLSTSSEAQTSPVDVGSVLSVLSEEKAFVERQSAIGQLSEHLANEEIRALMTFLQGPVPEEANKTDNHLGESDEKSQ